MGVALIDGDIVAFRAAAAAQREGAVWDEGDEPSPPTADAKGAARAACQTIETWRRLGRCKDAIVCFTGRENFRKRVLPSYKHNRAGKSKPLAYVYTVNAVCERFNTHTIEGLEADDLLGILATNGKHDGAIVMTLDKDLRTIPAVHMNPLKERHPVLITPEQADHKWMLQTLTGDPTDGYAGLPNVGAKRALALLPRDGLVKDLWPAVVKAYAAKGLPESEAISQARMARILRASDYKHKSGEIAMWHPRAPEWIKLREEN